MSIKPQSIANLILRLAIALSLVLCTQPSIDTSGNDSAQYLESSSKSFSFSQNITEPPIAAFDTIQRGSQKPSDKSFQTAIISNPDAIDSPIPATFTPSFVIDCFAYKIGLTSVILRAPPRFIS